MILKCLANGMFGSNCYVIGDKGEGVIIDAGVEIREVLQALQELGLVLKYIILTHSHIDHICSVDELRESTGAKLLVHADDAPALENPLLNGTALFGKAKSFGKADMLLKDGDIIEVGDLKLEIIHTPGHSPGGECIRIDSIVFTGDTLFKTSIGRTDLVNGSMQNLLDSIRSRLMTLEDETEVYPGHGEATSIGFEKKYNPFI